MERTAGILTWDQQYAEGRGLRYWPNEELVRFVGRHTADESLGPSSKVLELGCGNGANLWALAAMGFLATGIDASPEAVALATDYLAERDLVAHIEQGSMLEWPAWIRDQDAIVDVVSMQHLALEDHDAVYQHVAESLVPGGWFFTYHLGARTSDFGKGTLISPYTFDNISDPNAIFPNNGVVSMPTEEELVTRLTGAGLDVTRAETVTKTYGAVDLVEYHVIEATRQ
jgi:cyclopropane fatty-acyl-phospholipid synthase-like methyltransferase